MERPHVETPPTQPEEPPRSEGQSGARVHLDSLALQLSGDRKLPEGSALEDRFVLDTPLGRGGMGTVRRATDRRLLRPVAIKVIHAHLNWGAHQLRFAREAQITSQLEHPHIVPIYAFERSETGGASIVMRLIEGRTLHDYVQACRAACETGDDERPPHDLNSRLELLTKVCDGVQYAHDHGVVHRDLKPSNVMLGDHGEVYVVDWGLASVQGERLEDDTESEEGPLDTEVGCGQSPSNGSEPVLTRDGDIFGTPLYMSPEQARGDIDRLGPASDQYALGLMLFDLAFLKAARPSMRDPEVTRLAQLGTLLPMQHYVGRHVPDGLVAVVKRATALRAEDRYPDVAALARDLRRVQHAEPPSVLPESWLQRAWRRFNRNPVRAMRLVLAVLALAFAFTTATLLLRLVRERRINYERARIVELSAEVGGAAQSVEDALAHVEAMVNGWAKAMEQAVEFAPKGPSRAMEVSALRAAGAKAGLHYSARHGQPLTFERPSYVLAPTADEATAHAQLDRLSTLNVYVRRWLGISPSGAQGLKVTGDPNAVPILWVYAAFESGLMITYPGIIDVPEGYDPRQRPWYKDSHRDDRHAWRRPYRSVTGGQLQLPCTRGFYDREGRFQGLVGMDIALGDLQDRMRLDDVPAWESTFLLDEDGHVVASTHDAGPPRVLAGPQDPGLDFPEFFVPEIVEAARHGQDGGVAVRSDDLYVYQALRTLRWSLVFVFDETEAFAGEP